MNYAFFEGLLLGLTLAILLGPAFFTLIQTSIHRGFKSGALLAGGIFLSDLTLVVLCYLGLSQILNNKENQLAIGIIGSIILVIFGVITFNRKVNFQENDQIINTKTPGPVTFILKGFFLNIANPFILIFWMGVVSVVSSNYGMEDNSLAYFFLGTLSTVLITDLLKCFIANKIKQYLKPAFMQIVNRIVGIFLLIFGVILIFRVVYSFVYQTGIPIIPS